MQFIDLKAQQTRIRKNIEKRIQTVMDHGKYIMGPEVFELEEKLAAYVGVKHCISCSSGTDALLIPLMAKGIGKGDAVLTTPFTYIATAEVIALLGATPIFMDIYPETFNMNPIGINDAVNHANGKGLKPKAIIPVDLFGLPARYRLIEEQAEKYNIFVLEDAAQGFGGAIRDRKAGSFGHVAATSFFPAKPLGCYGDGGAIFTNDDELAEIMSSIRVHGSGSDRYDNIRIGINGRLDTIQAAILLEKLNIFDDEVGSKNKVAEYYSSNIKESIKTPHVPNGYLSSWAQYSLILPEDLERQSVMNQLKSKDIPSMVYYQTPLHLQSVFNKLGYKIGHFPVSEDISNTILSLPMHPYLDEKNQNKVLNAISDLDKN